MAIVYANHTCYLDPVVIGSFIKRQLRFMAKAELFRTRLLGNLILRLGAFQCAGERRTLER